MQKVLPVVFVHGLFGSFRDADMFRLLEPARASAPDLDGYGTRADRPVSFAGQIAALRNHIVTNHPGQRVHLVGHSIGAIYAFTVADQFPDFVASVVTVEGNFTLTDAFWSLSIAAMHEGDARASIEARLKDPAGFLAGDGIPITSEMLAHAESALAYQPWRTVWESAKAIVETTGRPEYLAMLQRVFTRVPVHLIAGERTVGGWDVPAWARPTARTDTVLPGVGHMMMLERPADLGRVLATVLT